MASSNWALELRVIGFRNPRVMQVADRVARWHLKRQVKDPELRQKLQPELARGGRFWISAGA